MTDKKQILVVDDSPNEIRILMELLKDDYAVIAAKSGEKAIEMVEEGSKPDLVLLDVMMETMDGYTACQKLHEILPDLPVIFVSANTQTEEILQGFDAGGIDYITKPVDEKVLLSKVGLVLTLSGQQKKLKAQTKEATDFINNAIASAGKLSVLLTFLRTGLKLKNHDELVNEVTEAFTRFELQGSILINLEDPIYASTKQAISPLEKELLLRSENMTDRFMEKASRLIIRFNDIAILIKNMPTDDDVLRGELKDYLMIMAEDIQGLSQKLNSEAMAHDKRLSMVAKALEDSQNALREFETYQKDHKESSIKIMDALMAEIESKYFEMGLTDQQEELISSILSQKVQEALEHMEGGLHIDDQLKTIADSLGEIAQSV